MKLTYLIIAVFGFIIGWNIFLIERDRKMIDSYYGNSQEQVK
jgi:hypothetical protein